MKKDCDYCGEEPPTDKIANPNLDMDSDIDWGSENSWWKVCKDCKEVIPLQRMSSFPDEKMQSYCNKKLQEIAERTGKPIMNAGIRKNKDGSYDTASIEFTGEKSTDNKGCTNVEG